MAKPVEGKVKLENSIKFNFEKAPPQVLMDGTLFTNPLLSQVTDLKGLHTTIKDYNFDLLDMF